LGINIVKPWTQTFQTDIGEQITVQLDDGTVMALNTASRVSVRFYSDARHVELEAGEALFNVAPDAVRPFHVETGLADIQAVGTAFNVDRREDHTTVTVVEGHVLVRPLHEPKKRTDLDGRESSGILGMPVALEESDRLIVNRSGAMARQRLDDVTPITAWTQRRLVFDGRLLAEVAAEFNRYNQKQIRIDDTSLAQRRVTGSFQADDPRSFLAFVSPIAGVSVRTLDGIHIVELEKHASKGGQTD